MRRRTLWWFLVVLASLALAVGAAACGGDDDEGGAASAAELRELITSTWTRRVDRGAEDRLAARDRAPLIPLSTLKRDPHLEMHTRGG